MSNMFELGQLLKESMEAEKEVIKKSLNESAELEEAETNTVTIEEDTHCFE